VLALLNLIYFIYKIVKYVPSGFIIIYHDNLKNIREINKQVQKTSDGAIDGSCLVNEIRRIIKKLKFRVKITYQKAIKKKILNFYNDPPAYLIQQYDIATRRMRKEVEKGIRQTSIPYLEKNMLVRRGVFMNGKVAEVIQSIDAIKSEYEYIVSQLGSKAELVDLEACNSFYYGTTPSILKCVICFNHHGTRNQKINKGLIMNICPRCYIAEDWMHIVQCKALDMRRKFITKLYNKLVKKAINK